MASIHSLPLIRGRVAVAAGLAGRSRPPSLQKDSPRYSPRYSGTLMTYSSEFSKSLFVRPLHWVHFALGDPTGGLFRQYSFQLPAAHKPKPSTTNVAAHLSP